MRCLKRCRPLSGRGGRPGSRNARKGPMPSERNKPAPIPSPSFIKPSSRCVGRMLCSPWLFISSAARKITCLARGVSSLSASDETSASGGELDRLALVRLAVEDKHNASVNTLRCNSQRSEKRRETLLAGQPPQHVFRADPPVFQREHLLAGQIEHPATLWCHEFGEGVEWRFLFLHTVPVPFHCLYLCRSSQSTQLQHANMTCACSQSGGNLGSTISLEVVQGQNSAISFWQEAEQVLHAHLDLLVSRCCIIAGEQLLLQATQRMHLVLTLRLPVINDGGTSRRVEPAARASGSLILPEPAQRLEKDRAGQVLGHSGIADLVRGKVLKISGIRAVHLRQPV